MPHRDRLRPPMARFHSGCLLQGDNEAWPGFPNHSGLSVLMTKRTARLTVTVLCKNQPEFTYENENLGREMKREELTRYLDTLLEVARYRDYCPNGLQVEGMIGRIVAGVTASQALVDAVERRADVLLVHHGWLWR